MIKIKFENNYIAKHDIIKKRFVAYLPNNNAVFMEFEKEEIQIGELLGMIEIFKHKLIENS